jgi:hypothetical protein
LQHRHQVTGQFVGISARRKITFSFCSLQATTQRNFAGSTARSYFFPNGSRRISARKRTLNHEASCRKSRITGHVGSAE